MTPARGPGQATRRAEPIAEDLEFDQINQVLAGLGDLTVPQLKEVQKEFLGAISGKIKQDLIAALKREIFSYRESRLRQKGSSICERTDHSSM